MKVKLISQMVNMNKKMISILIGTVLVGTIFSVSIPQMVNAKETIIEDRQADFSLEDIVIYVDDPTIVNAYSWRKLTENDKVYTRNQCNDKEKFTQIRIQGKFNGETVADKLQCTYVITREGDENYQEIRKSFNAEYNEYSVDSFVTWSVWKAGTYNIKLIAKDQYGNVQTKERKINVLKNPDEEKLLIENNRDLGNPQFIWNAELDKNTCSVGDTLTVKFDYDTADRQGINFKGHTKAFLMLKSIENPFIYHTIRIYSEDLSGHNTAQLSYTFGESCNDHQGGSFKEGHYNISLYIAPEGTSYSFEYPLYDNFTVTPKVDTPADNLLMV